MLTTTQEEELLNLLMECNDDTKVYLGCDSIRMVKNGKKVAKFAAVVIVHMNGNKGCRIFPHITYEDDYDLKPNRPKMRMMNEVRKVCDLYMQVGPLIDDFKVEIHLDISLDPKNGSNCAATEAAGYVLGMTGIEPMLKPNSWASSFGADGVVNKGMYAAA